MEEKKIRHYHLMTKFMHIITKLARIFLIIGTVFLVFALVIVPLIVNSIKYDANKQTIKAMGMTINYEKEDGAYIFKSDNNDDLKIAGKDEVKAVEQILEYLEKDNLSKVCLVIEITIVFAIATVILNYIALRYIDRVFVSMSEDDTPFVEDHPSNFRKAANFLIVMVLVQFCSGIISSLMMESDISLAVEFRDIGVILVLFILAYVFEYGYKLQSKSDIKMIKE